MQNIVIKPGDLVVVAARPGCGKTTFAINMMCKGTPNGKKLYCSCEMTTENILEKASKCAPKALDFVICDDTLAMDLKWLETMIIDGKFNMIFIDHLQIFNGNIRTLTRELKRLCLKYKVAIVALSQLNRSAAVKDPETGMLRDSGTIEQDADLILFLKQHSVKIAKNRHGPVSEVLCEHDFATGQYDFDSKKYLKYKQYCDIIIDEYDKNYNYRASKRFFNHLHKIEKYDAEMAAETLHICCQIQRMKTKLAKSSIKNDVSFVGLLK